MKLSNDIIVQELDEDAILLDMGSESYYGLNETGHLILSMVSSGASREEVVSKLTQIYDVDAKMAGHDFDLLISELKRKNFLI